MKFVPVITSDHIKATGESFGRSSAEWLAGICNKAMEIALAEQATQEQPLITAEEARKLGAGNAEWLTSKGNWCMCGAKDFLSLSIGGEVIKYRAIKKEVPAEPTVLRSDFDFCMQDKQRAIKVLEDTYKLICEDKLHEAKELLEKRVNNLMVNIPPFIEPAEPQPWLNWRGGDCPVPDGVMVEVTLRSSYPMTGFAEKLVWGHDKRPSDIIEYRVIGIAEGWVLT